MIIVHSILTFNVHLAAMLVAICSSACNWLHHHCHPFILENGSVSALHSTYQHRQSEGTQGQHRTTNKEHTSLPRSCLLLWFWS